MKTEKTFISAKECEKIQNQFSKYAEQGGWDGYELDGSHNLSEEKCENIASQFESAARKGGEYFVNIIRYPHFINNEIDAILEII